MVTEICDPNKSGARHHRSFKLGSKLKYLKALLTLLVVLQVKLSVVPSVGFVLFSFTFVALLSSDDPVLFL